MCGRLCGFTRRRGWGGLSESRGRPGRPRRMSAGGLSADGDAFVEASSASVACVEPPAPKQRPTEHSGRRRAGWTHSREGQRRDSLHTSRDAAGSARTAGLVTGPQRRRAPEASSDALTPLSRACGVAPAERSQRMDSTDPRFAATMKGVSICPGPTRAERGQRPRLARRRATSGRNGSPNTLPRPQTAPSRPRSRPGLPDTEPW